ncbi:hypothetical protein RFI_18611, partial [Reticulomyxa filosa]
KKSQGKKKKVTYEVDGEKFVVFDYYKPIKQIGQGAYAVVMYIFCCSHKERKAPSFFFFFFFFVFCILMNLSRLKCCMSFGCREAIDVRNGQKVAIKKNKGVFSTLSDAKRILREIKLLSHFDHENTISLFECVCVCVCVCWEHMRTMRNNGVVLIQIISLIGVIPPDSCEQDDFDEVYLVMPCMETTLARVIQSRQHLSARHKQYFMYQLLRGLKYMHDAGVWHRDLKPENILINCGDCRLKITDFGLARGVSKDANVEPNLTEYVVTRWYRAPEVMCSSRHYDEKVDLWSVGCIMGELYYRKPLFPGSNHIDQLNLIFECRGVPSDVEWIKTLDAKRWVEQMEPKPKRDLSKLLPGISPEAADLLDQLLELNPAKRPGASTSMRHAWLKSMYREKDEQRHVDIFDLSFEFERQINTLFGVRHMMYEELASFSKRQLKKAMLKNQGKYSLFVVVAIFVIYVHCMFYWGGGGRKRGGFCRNRECIFFSSTTIKKARQMMPNFRTTECPFFILSFFFMLLKLYLYSSFSLLNRLLVEIL